MADIFISYARPDRETIAALSAALEQAGWSVWWDRHIDGGSAFAQAIETELEASRVVIVAWSQTALRSDWVKDEAAAARDQGKLVPVSLDGTMAPLGFRQYHAIDFSAWGGDPSSPAYSDLRRSLEARLGGVIPASRPAPQPTPATAGQEASAAALPSRKLVLVVVGLVTLVAALVLGYRWFGDRASDAPGIAADSAPTRTLAAAGSEADTARDKSIAVLPFDNRSAQADDAYFAEGMHDDLLSQLAKVPDLRVTSRTSVLRYADTAKSIREIAAELGVGVVLEGAVQRAGDRVRINVQLIDARSDTHLWSETFDRELTVANLFDIQSEITRAIAGELKSVLGASSQPMIAKLPTESTEAYDAWLLGNSLYRYEQLDPELIQRSAASYGRAVAIDPEFAAAHARKAEAHLTLVWWGVDAAENTELAEQSLERAHALAPRSNATRVAEGYYRYWVKSDYAGASAAVREALEQSPQDTSLWELHGSIARRAGDMAAANASFERAMAVDPKNPDFASQLAYNAAQQGKLADARRWLSRARALSPDSQLYNREALILRLSGDVDATWRRYEELRAESSTDRAASFMGLATSLRDPAHLEVLQARLANADLPGTFGLEAQLYRAVALERLGRSAEARTLAQDLKSQLSRYASSLSTDGRGHVATLTIALDAILGNTTAARAGAATLSRSPPPDHMWIVELAPLLMNVYAGLGEPDAAFDLVERAMDEFSPAHFVHIRNDVAFDRYRELPRYRTLDARYEAWKTAQPGDTD